MPRQPQRELLDLADRLFLRECIDRVFLRIGGDNVAVVTRQVAAGKIARQRDADADVLDLVNRAEGPSLGHPDKVCLSFAVLVRAQSNGHGLTFLYMCCNRRGSEGAGCGSARESPTR